MRLYILLLLTVYINTNIYSQIKPKITTNQISNLLVDSTRLENDSILVYYQNGIIIGRDTISGTGGSVGGVTGSGTTNYLSKFTDATTLGNSTLYDDGTNVGIGIINPLNRLHIRSTGSADTYQLLLESDSATTGSRAGINIATVKSTGGVISPFLRFDLGSNYTTKTHSASFGIYGNNADGGYTEYMWIGVANKNSYNNAAMKIDSFGRVGINILTTNLPTSTLDVNGNTNITGKLLLNDATSSIYVGSNNATTATTANSNLGVGNNALLSLTTGDDNIAIGTDASYTLTTGIQNISIGKGAATGATSSINNIAIGNLTLNVSNGESNIGIGTLALGSATTGNNNIAIGHYAGQNHSSATESIYIGKSTTGTSAATNEMVIGSNAVGQGTNTTVINSTSTVRTTIQGDTLVVPKFLNVDTATFFVNADSNRVGISTTSPLANFHVNSFVDSNDLSRKILFGNTAAKFPTRQAFAEFGGTHYFNKDNSSYMFFTPELKLNYSITNAGAYLVNFSPFITTGISMQQFQNFLSIPTLDTITGTILDFSNAYFRNDFKSTTGAVTNSNTFEIASPFVYSVSAISPTNHTGIIIKNQGRSGVTNSYGLKIDNQTGSTTNYALYIGGGRVEIDGLPESIQTALYINANGVVSKHTSSIRYKTDIKDYNKGLDYLMKLNPVWFTYKSSGQTNAGFIAEQIHEAGLEEFVTYTDEGIIEGLKGEYLKPLIVKAIQEQQQIIESQQTKITTLENTINQLIQRIELLENN